MILKKQFSKNKILPLITESPIIIILILTWISPSLTSFLNIQENIVYFMIFELVLCHFGGFISPLLDFKESKFKSKNVLTFISFAIFYSLFVIALCYTFNSIFPLIQFWYINFLRLKILLKENKRSDISFAKISVARIILYLISFIPSAILPLPELGANAQSLQLGGSGFFTDEPQRALFWGIIYFIGSYYIDTNLVKLSKFIKYTQ